MKIEKISKMALYICVGIIIVCFAAFFSIGFNNPVGDYNEPMLTDLLLILMYALFLVMVGLTVWSVFKGIGGKSGGSASASGVPGGKIITFTIVLLIVSLVIGIISGLGEEAFTAQDGTVTSAGWVSVVDMFCVSIGILFLAAVISVAVSMTGIVTTMGNKTKSIK